MVITERLHGHILCLLGGIPNVLIDNSYGKNAAFYSAWTHDWPGTGFVNTPAAAKARAQQLLEGDVMADGDGVMLFSARPRRPLMRWFYRGQSLAAIVVGDCRGRLLSGCGTRGQDTPAAIYPVYFSCAADFEYLRLSIRSLTAHCGGHVGRIHVYEDRNQPLTDAQKLALVNETRASDRLSP